MNRLGGKKNPLTLIKGLKTSSKPVSRVLFILADTSVINLDRALLPRLYQPTHLNHAEAHKAGRFI